MYEEDTKDVTPSTEPKESELNNPMAPLNTLLNFQILNALFFIFLSIQSTPCEFGHPSGSWYHLHWAYSLSCRIKDSVKVFLYKCSQFLICHQI